MVKIKIATLFILFVSPFALAANPKTTPTPEPTPPDLSRKSSLEQSLIQSNIAVSEFFDSAAEGLDIFLTGKHLSDQRNKTRVRIENSSQTHEGSGVINRTQLKLYLNLPNFEKYFRLKFSSYDDQDERGVREQYFHATPRERNYGASIGFFRTLGKVKTSFEPRVQLTNPLKVANTLSFESLGEIKKFNINPKIQFFAHPDKGTGIFNSLNINWQLAKLYSITLINELEYDDKLIPHFRTTNGPILTQVINERTTMSYNLLFASTNSPNYHLDSYDVSIAWNQIVYKMILDYQVIPHLTFAKSKHYKGDAGFIFNLNLNF